MIGRFRPSRPVPISMRKPDPRRPARAPGFLPRLAFTLPFGPLADRVVIRDHSRGVSDVVDPVPPESA